MVGLNLNACDGNGARAAKEGNQMAAKRKSKAKTKAKGKAKRKAKRRSKKK